MTYSSLLKTSAIAAMLCAAPAALAGPVLTIEDFVGTVNVTTQGSAIKITASENEKDIRLTESGSELYIDGGIHRPDSKRCEGYYGRFNWSWGDKQPKQGEFGGYENLDDFPNLDITVPADTKVVIENAIIFGSFGDIGSADIAAQACSNLSFGNITADAVLDLDGSGDITAKNIGRVTAKLDGSGDIHVENTGEFNAALSGSGDLSAKTVQSANLTLSGSGDIQVGDIKNDLKARLSGSGDIQTGDVDGGATLSISGSGDMTIGDVNGPVSVKSSGSNTVELGGGTASSFEASIAGSGEIEFDGIAMNPDLKVVGSGDIEIGQVKS